MDLFLASLAMITGYLAGSVSFARVVTRLFAPGQSIDRIKIQVPDSQAVYESDAISATSVRLHLGPRYGCLTGILDILKAVIPTLAFRLWQPEAPYYLLAAGMAAVGHVWPLYYRFKGGRGMSPIVGGMLVVDPVGFLVTSSLGTLSDLAIRNLFVSSGIWLVLMIPWTLFLRQDGAQLVYVTAMSILFWGSMIPEWREMLRLRREGVLENLQQAKEVRVISRRDGGTAEQMTLASAVAKVVSRLRTGARP